MSDIIFVWMRTVSNPPDINQFRMNSFFFQISWPGQRKIHMIVSVVISKLQTKFSIIRTFGVNIS